MILTADIGNSYLKMRYFDDNEKIIKSYDYTISEALNLNPADFPLPKKAIFSDVSEKLHHFAEYFIEKGVKTLKMQSDLRLPVKICYKTPNSLGQDRLAAVCGAVSKFPNKNILIIDAGTAICFDFVDENANYLGGNISPGIDLRFKSLNNYTSKLPLLNKNYKFVEIADNTELAVASGVLNGVLY
ncbi:MAG: type III pantothenate kinase, partial [Bacteroidales bacterium]|nr:type III pantothenate kinase [Bacteroidales bacterium]